MAVTGFRLSADQSAAAPRARPLIAILVAYAALGLLYLTATPPLEASDEVWHMGMVQHIAETWTLPVQDPTISTPWEQEGSQPPLYYALAAALVTPIDRGDFDAARAPNPHAIAGVPGAVGNKNLTLPDSAGGTTAAVTLIRLWGLLLGAITVGMTYRAARLIAPDAPTVAPLAAGLVAFNPMFLFISASVNNDNLVTALNSVAIVLMLYTLRDGFETRRSFALALLIALAGLSKLSGLVLAPAAAALALWVAVRRGDARGFVTFGAFGVLLVGGLCGPWLLRNWLLYDELFGTAMMVAVAGPRLEPFSLAVLLGEFEGFRFAYWGLFGAVNIMTFRPFYDVMDLLTLAAAAGLLIHLWRRRGDRDALAARALPLLIVTLGAGAVIAWTAQTYASQGRLLFPYNAAIGPLLALGLFELIRKPGARLIPAALALFALTVPAATLIPAYTPPAALAALPETARPVYARFGPVELVGYETPDRRYAPGDSVPIIVYWRVVEQDMRDLSLYLHAVTADGAVVGKVDSYPGGGLLRTSTWEPGALLADVYAIPLDDLPATPSTLRVQVGWWHYPSGEVIEAMVDAAPLAAVLLDAGAYAAESVVEAVPADLMPVEGVAFGGAIALEGWRRDGLDLLLLWRALRPPAADYTVFVQALDAGGAVAAGGDAPPALPTRHWRAGEQFITRHTLDLPPGDYRLIVGWYDPITLARLDAPFPDSAYPLAVITAE